jgi:hypothetical protein
MTNSSHGVADCFFSALAIVPLPPDGRNVTQYWKRREIDSCAQPCFLKAPYFQCNKKYTFRAYKKLWLHIHGKGVLHFLYSNYVTSDKATSIKWRNKIQATTNKEQANSRATGKKNPSNVLRGKNSEAHSWSFECGP